MVHATPEKLCDMFVDFATTKLVDPMFIGGTEVEKIDDTSRIVHYRYQLPPMIANRDFLFQSYPSSFPCYL